MGAVIEFKRPEPAKPTHGADEVFRSGLPDPKNEVEAEIFCAMQDAWEEHARGFTAWYALNNQYRDAVGMPRLGQ